MKNITFVNFPLETNPSGNYFLKNQCSSTTMSKQWNKPQMLNNWEMTLQIMAY